MSSRSGAEVRDALLNGQPVSWGFNPTEKRVVLTLPQALGGETHILCIKGFYTFTVPHEVRGQLLAQFSGAALPSSLASPFAAS
ncbi:MAG TPA: hypothetical protein VEZ90_08750 [Blastocatellia bacterium]|nr:hypothetical protein [Blastocatellia bacterium]